MTKIELHLFYKKNLLLLLTLFLLIPSQIISQTSNKWYVKKNASGNNSGSSWINAWIELDQINWSLISAGDTIFISGGTSNLVYNTTLTVNKTGQPSKFIVITKGADGDNNGEVIIDGQGSLSSGIVFNKTSEGGLSYIKVSDITLVNHTSSVLVRQLTNVIYLENLKIRGQRGQGAIFINGYNSNNNYNLIDSIFVKNCDIKSDYQTVAQTDNIYVQYANNVFILNNTIEQLNTFGTQHNDCIQTTWYLGNQTIANNKLYNAKENDSQGIMLHTSLAGHETNVNNNVIYSGGNGTALFEHAPYPNNIGNAKYYNNTFYVKGASGYISQALILAHKNVDLKNNIFVSNGVGAIQFNTTTTTSVSSDHNLFKSADDRYTIVIDGYGRSLSYWQGLNGQDLNSLVANPLFVNVENKDVSILETSPAIDEGITLGNQYSISLNGINRPQGAAWDIGAYEYFNGTVLDIIPPELIGAEIIDSTTIILEFSEAMNESSVEDINNYAVNNGIIILSATMNGNQVNLNTTEHSPGIYEVVVSNVTDLAGNVINNNYNSFIYEYFNQNLNLTQLPVVQADADHWYLNYTPDRTIDGIAGGESRWGGAVPMPDTIEYRLNDLQVLNQTRLSFYAWESGRIYNYTIQVSIDSLTWNEIKSNIPSHSEQWSVEDFDPVETKYIRVILLSNNQSVWAGLWEAEFWGHLKIPTNNDDEKNIPAEFMLEQNYPNPFNPNTTISYTISKPGLVELTVFDILGNEVSKLINEFQDTGKYSVQFNSSKFGLSSGIYIYQIKTMDFIQTRKMVLLK